MFEHVMDLYQRNALTISRKDQVALREVSFYLERHVPGLLVEHPQDPRGDDVLTGKAVDTGRDIITVVVDSALHPRTFSTLPGFASSGRTGNGAALMILRNVAVNPIWAGLVLRHEATHAAQYSKKPHESLVLEGKPDNPREEQEAYAAQIKTLDVYSDRRFVVMLREAVNPRFSGPIPIVGRDDVATLDFIGPPESDSEVSNRRVFLTYALNFALIESRFSNRKKVKRAQTEYLASVLNP